MKVVTEVEKERRQVLARHFIEEVKFRTEKW